MKDLRGALKVLCERDRATVRFAQPKWGAVQLPRFDTVAAHDGA